MQGKKILLGICGGIAAYKSAELTRELIKSGAQVRVVMTKNACEFITPLTLQTLSRNEVHIASFTPPLQREITHIALAEFPDIFVIAPATANIIGKMANGIADDLLSTVALALKAPILLSPAMNEKMYANPIVQANIAKLKGHGIFVMDAAYGELACQAMGSGRMPDIAEIIDEIQTILSPDDLRGKVVLVGAGPTREALDPVRFISNHSTGKMGFAVALAARRRGAKVILVSGPTHLAPPRGVQLVRVNSAVEMREAMLANFPAANIVVQAAAVADYRPKNIAVNKIKKDEGALSGTWERNPDILAELGLQKAKRVLVGFAMETEDLVENAQKKRRAKNLDLVVANCLFDAGAGFATDTNLVKIIGKDGSVEDLPLMEKIELADIILDRALAITP